MWNIPRSIGQMGPVMVPLKTHKRDFASINLTNVAIAPGKSFRNPNFVNKHPSVHCCYSATPISIPVHKVCQNSDSDTSGTVTNSSPNNLVDKSAKEIYCEESPVRKSPVGGSPVCSGRKRCKKLRKSRKKKASNKNSKQNNSRRQINDMMEIDLEPDVSMNGCEGNISISPKTLHLTDFIVDIPTKMNDEVFTFISISPPSNNRSFPRERELSVCESEDSFIVFDSGTDEELKFSDSDIAELDTDDDDDESDSDIDDDFDSSFSVLPCKRVSTVSLTTSSVIEI